MGTYEVGYWGHPHTLLPDDADHCPGQAVGALRSNAELGLSPVTGPVEVCRWFRLCKAQGGSKQRAGGSYSAP
jgi:hypothetical protein